MLCCISSTYAHSLNWPSWVVRKLSYPSKARIARRVRVAVFPRCPSGADSPHATLRRPRPCPPFVVPWRPATCCDRLSWSARPIAGSDRSYV